jgi:putative intracellular protease/amidase
LTDGVEQSELTEPRKALEKAGAKTILISPAANTVQAMKHKEKGDTFKVAGRSTASIPTISTGYCCPAASRTRTNCAPTLTR